MQLIPILDYHNLTKSLMVSMSAKGKRVRGVLTRLKREREVKIRSAVSLLCSGSLSREKYHWVIQTTQIPKPQFFPVWEVTCI